MATWQQIIDRARRLGYVDSYQYLDADAELDMNIVQEEIASAIITEIWEDFFWEIFFTDLIDWQNEYNLPSNSNKLLSLSYLPNSTTTVYRKLDTKYPYELPNDISYYETSWDEFYYIADGSIFIYPKPTDNITDWLKLYWIKNLNTISKTSTESEILNWKIPAKYHHIISLWMLEFIYRWQWNLQYAWEARNRYLSERSKLIEFLWDRVATQLIWWLPNLNYFE